MNIQQGIFWLILTVFLEARDQTPKGQKNVAKVIMNRANKKNWPLSNIVFAKKQFSCYNEGFLKAFTHVANEVVFINPVSSNVSDAVDEWKNGDTLKGATHYFNPDLVPGRWPASWDKKKMTVLFVEGDHVFLRED